MADTLIYTKPGCPYCAAAMADMRKRSVRFVQIDVEADLTARKEMERLSGALRVPTIVEPDGSVIVGFDGF
ncbi:MAG: glutaredoxin family protein [Candidatus Eremiobacteraeota bacterium]|nr:glutaredoxin family protein [Candidatus Eremiobacteraeota bacterium]MBC5828021.1 glutaredoxin family protein [Candidatus Eremiobacteraeota bacterium]